MTNTLRSFLIVFNVNKLPVTSSQLQAFIKDNKNINTWWNYVPLVYSVTSTLDADSLVDVFSAFFDAPDVEFIVAEINPKNTEGRLPPVAWEGFVADVEDVASGSAVES